MNSEQRIPFTFQGTVYYKKYNNLQISVYKSQYTYGYLTERVGTICIKHNQKKNEDYYEFLVIQINSHPGFTEYKYYDYNLDTERLLNFEYYCFPCSNDKTIQCHNDKTIQCHNDKTIQCHNDKTIQIPINYITLKEQCHRLGEFKRYVNQINLKNNYDGIFHNFNEEDVYPELQMEIILK
jgi:hypothetical protein